MKDPYDVNKIVPWKDYILPMQQTQHRHLTEVAQYVREKLTASHWGMYCSSIPGEDLEEAVQELNEELSKAILGIPSYQVLGIDNITEIVVRRMDKLREKHGHTGVSDSEGRYCILDIMDNIQERLGL